MAYIMDIVMRWGHIVFGVAWIGLLYYFNFVQTEYVKEADDSAKADVMAKLAPRALWWFRWAAMFTFLSGLLLLGYILHMRLSLGITLGALMGTIMMLNVWLIIWPNQKIVIGLESGDKAAAGPKAALASRTNTLFSIPLLWAMTGAANVPGTYVVDSLGLYWAIALGLIILLEINALASSFPLQGMLGKVSSTLHLGFGLAIVLYILQHVL